MTASLEWFLSSGHAAELILLLVVLEGLFLWLRYRRGVGSAPGKWLSPLVAGAALVLALRLVQGGAYAGLTGLSLAIAGVAHLLGSRQRWER
jgi:hypothetical protein